MLELQLVEMETVSTLGTLWTSETKGDNQWGKQALFLTFAQYRRLYNNLNTVIYLIVYNCKNNSVCVSSQ